MLGITHLDFARHAVLRLQQLFFVSLLVPAMLAALAAGTAVQITFGQACRCQQALMSASKKQAAASPSNAAPRSVVGTS